MATNSVINSSVTRGISILIDQPQQEIERSQRQQQRHAIAKINISPNADTTTRATTKEVTYTASTPSATFLKHSTLGRDMMMLVDGNMCNNNNNNNNNGINNNNNINSNVIQSNIIKTNTINNSSSNTNKDNSITSTTNSNTNNNNNNNSNLTTYIDINSNAVEDDQNWRTCIEPKKSTAATSFSRLQLRAETSQERPNNNNDNTNNESTMVTAATTTTTTPSERRKSKASELKAEEKPKIGHKVHVVDDSVGMSGVGISVTHGQKHNNNKKNNSHIYNREQLKPVANDEVVTTATATTIIFCDDANDEVDYSRDYHANSDDDDDDDVVESRFASRLNISGHGVVNVVGSNHDAPDDVSVGVGQPLMASVVSAQADQLEDIAVASSLRAVDCASALTESVVSDAPPKQSHVVKIKISPNLSEGKTLAYAEEKNFSQSFNLRSERIKSEKLVSVVRLKDENTTQTPLELQLRSNDSKMVQKPGTPPTGSTTNSGNTTVTELNVSPHHPSPYLYYMMSSGQFSPCDTLDSGTGSDFESNNNSSNVSGNSSRNINSVSSLNGSASAQLGLNLNSTKLRMLASAGADDKHHHHHDSAAGVHKLAASFTDSEESESSLSCDSLNSSEYLRPSSNSPTAVVPKPPIIPASTPPYKSIASMLPDSLLRDIRDRKFATNDFVSKYVDDNTALYDSVEDTIEPIEALESLKVSQHLNDDDGDSIDYHEAVTHAKYVRDRNASNVSNAQRASSPDKKFAVRSTEGTFVDAKINSMPRKYEADQYYDFHVNEHENFRRFGRDLGVGDACSDTGSWMEYESQGQQEDAFAGYRDIRLSSLASTIRSSKGTVRGVKNRVRNGIATFLQLQQPNVKNYKEKDLGKVVLYTTSMGIIRDTYAKCSNVKQILRTLLVKFEERDVFMSVEYQQEIRQRMQSDAIKVPQLFVEGQHIGDAETVERLNESGELRQLLKPYKSIATTYTCQTCGGYRLLPCPSCNGSKKSVHRNHFTAEFVALKCMNCDEVGLVKCHNC